MSLNFNTLVQLENLNKKLFKEVDFCFERALDDKSLKTQKPDIIVNHCIDKFKIKRKAFLSDVLDIIEN